MKSAEEWLKEAEILRRECRFGEAINAFRRVESADDATEAMRMKARVSVELIQEINGFVNKDLMNP